MTLGSSSSADLQQAGSSKRTWDINDSKLPLPERHDAFQLWPNGHCRYAYSEDSDEAKRHTSGWAMRNTNNHNVSILKKSCLGVLVCSRGCLGTSGTPLALRPAICDKARKKQCGKPCPNAKCDGVLTLQACRGHSGYPVTHFWRHLNGCVYFQAKGAHDHAAPDLKPSEEFRKGNRKATKRPAAALARRPAAALDCVDQVDGPIAPAKALRLQAFVGHGSDMMPPACCSPFSCSWQPEQPAAYHHQQVHQPQHHQPHHQQHQLQHPNFYSPEAASDPAQYYSDMQHPSSAAYQHHQQLHHSAAAAAAAYPPLPIAPAPPSTPPPAVQGGGFSRHASDAIKSSPDSPLCSPTGMPGVGIGGPFDSAAQQESFFSFWSPTHQMFNHHQHQHQQLHQQHRSQLHHQPQHHQQYQHYPQHHQHLAHHQHQPQSPSVAAAAAAAAAAAWAGGCQPVGGHYFHQQLDCTGGYPAPQSAMIGQS